MLQMNTTEDGPVPCPACGGRRYVQIEVPMLVTREDGREAWVEGEACYEACGNVWLPGTPVGWLEER